MATKPAAPPIPLAVEVATPLPQTIYADLVALDTPADGEAPRLRPVLSIVTARGTNTLPLPPVGDEAAAYVLLIGELHGNYVWLAVPEADAARVTLMQPVARLRVPAAATQTKQLVLVGA